MEEYPIIQKIRDGMDELFLWSEDKLKPNTKDLFVNLWIDWFAEIYLKSKKYGFAVSNKILQDLVKLSFVVYGNLDKLPLQKKVILPEKSWSYKFIVTSLPHPFMREASQPEFQKEDTNVLFMISTWDSMHAKIAEKLWLQWNVANVNILWWARVDVDHDKKTLNIRDDSWSYWSCSNQFVERMLEDYAKQWYAITIDMKHQIEFFPK